MITLKTHTKNDYNSLRLSYRGVIETRTWAPQIIKKYHKRRFYKALDNTEKYQNKDHPILNVNRYHNQPPKLKPTFHLVTHLVSSLVSMATKTLQSDI